MRCLLALISFSFMWLLCVPPSIAADCDILKNKCGKTKSKLISGTHIAHATQLASESKGKQSYTKVRGNCNVDNNGATVRLPQVLTGPQKCEIKLLTGGKSHSKMKKRCAFSKWNISSKTMEKTDGLGGVWIRKIIKRPKNNTRQKMWHVMLSANRPNTNQSNFADFAFMFQLGSVRLKAPATAPIFKKFKSSDDFISTLRDYCFR